MRFHTDEHFAIGNLHVVGGKPCQDHALSGTHEGIAYAVVSDGCSGGGHTDVGARLMTLSTAAAIREHWSSTKNAIAVSASQDVVLRQRLILGGIKEALRLEPNDMLATCAYVYLTPEGGFVHLRGDGVIALVYKGTKSLLYRYDWPDNKPFYPAYVENTLPGFVKAHGGDINAKVLREEPWGFNRQPDGVEPYTPGEVSLYSIAEGIRGITVPITAEELKKLAYVAVFSDGVTQIDNFDWKDAAVNLLAFRSVEGVFVKRRMKAFIDAARKLGKGPLDDIGYAVVRIDHNEEKTDGS